MTACGLRALRGAMEGISASILCTCDAEGQPNVSMISQVHWVDDDHVALSWQFFNKTRANLMATGRACVEIFDPSSHARHRLHLDHVETRTEGPLYEMMKARLAGIASHHGLEGVFRLLGADIFRVTGIDELIPPTAPSAADRPPRLSALRSCIDDLARCRDFDELADAVLDGVVRHLNIPHAILLMTEGDGRLFAIGSRGYAASGIGAEILPGEGVIGVAAREGVPIRIGHLSADYRYGAALGAAARQAGLLAEDPHGVPFPGLGDPHSQIAVPIFASGRVCGRVLGVLFCESPEIMRFDHEDEDALTLLSAFLGARAALPGDEDAQPPADPPGAPAIPAGQVVLRHYPCDGSVFLDGDYLIKGVAGAILWRLLCQNADSGRTEFTTRELRLDRTLRLPDHAENLDARLVLLRRRLDERGACLRIEKTGRGRFRLIAACAIALQDMGAATQTPA